MCCTARQTRLKKVNTTRAAQKANKAIADGKKAGIKPKKITPKTNGTPPPKKTPKTCAPCAKKRAA